ncbi:hypothetical protein [Streptomyces sviceus]|uniref:hypothetical protein n=1 Tax=Streptomyces sviceus TaxID=285530 RepID=UPI00332A0CD3
MRRAPGRPVWRLVEPERALGGGQVVQVLAKVLCRGVLGGTQPVVGKVSDGDPLPVGLVAALVPSTAVTRRAAGC